MLRSVVGRGTQGRKDKRSKAPERKPPKESREKSVGTVKGFNIMSWSTMNSSFGARVILMVLRAA